MVGRPLTEEEKKLLAERKAVSEQMMGAPKRFAITLQNIIEHGATLRCNGCKSALQQKTNRLPHTNACRDRFAEVLKDNKKVQASKTREGDYYTKVVEEEDKERSAQASSSSSSGEANKRIKTETNVESEWNSCSLT